MFYNVENLFDTFDDPQKRDNEFMPESDKEWTINRFYGKLNKIYTVIASTGWHAPDIIGFAEVENYFCMEQLLLKTPLVNKNYSIVHYESPDVRGIDVALIYNSKKCKLIQSRAIHVDISEFNGAKTRDILHAQFSVKGNGDFHVFVNHWPSRRGGVNKSEPKRMIASKTLRKVTDSILQVNPNANIVIMGDFNDGPDNASIQELNKGQLHNTNVCTPIGTLKYQGRWECYDQFIISSALQSSYSSFFSIVHPPFIMEEDNAHVGSKPKRTYQGPIYKGGYSDHLPIMLKVTRR